MKWFTGAMIPLIFLVCGCIESTSVPPDEGDEEEERGDRSSFNDDGEDDDSAIDDGSQDNDSPDDGENDEDDAVVVSDCECLAPYIWEVLAEYEIASLWEAINDCFALDDPAALAVQAACLPQEVGFREGWEQLLVVEYREEIVFPLYREIGVDDCHLSFAAPIFDPITGDFIACVPEELFDEIIPLL